MAKMKKKSTPSKSILAKAKGVASAGKALLTGKSAPKKSGSRKRNRGPQYWANKVIVAKLKKKYYKMRYGSV